MTPPDPAAWRPSTIVAASSMIDSLDPWVSDTGPAVAINDHSVQDGLSRFEVARLARFDDYHRTVVGYHGTGLSTALRIVNQVEGFRWSRRNFDWLGHGVYFWEHAPRQARDWAELRRQQVKRKRGATADEIRKANEPIAVVASMIRLGFCFDLLEPENVEFLLSIFEDYRQSKELAEEPLPENNRKYRKLDCAVFEYAYKVISAAPEHPSVDTSRGVYVPAGGDRRVWAGSWVSRRPYPALHSESDLHPGNMAALSNRSGGR